MTALLSFGSFLLAFSPTLSLLFSIIFQKPQLVILAITAAFAYLLSALLSSLFWLPVPNSMKHGSDGSSSVGMLLALVIPSVICQMIVRCGFVKVYFRVEGVIRRSVMRHEEETAAAAAARSGNHRHNSNNNNIDNSNNNGGGRNSNSNYCDNEHENSNSNNNNDNPHAETNALQLQLNDLSCSLAAGCGYALLHSLFLYGTLLASESGETTTTSGGGGVGGTLYQPSCSQIPSLIHGAIIACMFSILDVFWMMLTFFGMRRRSLYSSSSCYNYGHNNSGMASWQQTLREALTFPTKGGLSDSISGGNAALGLVATSHLLASLVLAPNGMMEQDGCQISLPLLAGVVVLVGVLFGRGVKGHFLPEDQRRRILGLRMEENHSFGGAGGGSGVM